MIRILMTMVFIAAMSLNLFAKTTSVSSKGKLSFRIDNELYQADSLHARGYAVKQTGLAFINGANQENMIVNIEWKNMKAPGSYIITTSNGKAEFTIKNKIHSILQQGDFLKINIVATKTIGSFLLLTGKFEGQLRDKNGNAVIIKDGNFTTYSL